MKKLKFSLIALFLTGLCLTSCKKDIVNEAEQPSTAESGAKPSESTLAEHHHHLRGSNCGHGLWATDDVNGHHHHKRGANCYQHGVWATDDVNGHHHHKRGDNCPEHNRWATSDPFYGW
ncbi:hypothetical protein V9K67_23365 [Paraflavisolibacter sp. H34]|uniref:hypothetical protein n=1 Tax=Huijunlia imazamoxiresistens TaxID=3127457 RepID=UPI00301601D5